MVRFETSDPYRSTYCGLIAITDTLKGIVNGEPNTIPSKLKTGSVDYVHQLVADEKIAVLWASHLIDEVHSEDRLIVLHHGQIKAKGSVPEILALTQTDQLAEAFNTLTKS